jgi:hypothetical protein
LVFTIPLPAIAGTSWPAEKNVPAEYEEMKVKERRKEESSYMPFQLICCIPYLPLRIPFRSFLTSSQSVVAVGSTHATKDPSPIITSNFNNANEGLHTHDFC